MNQPYPGDIDWAACNGIRTIVTARHDPRHGGHALVAEACARHGLAYETFADTNFLDPTYFLFSRAAPSREVLLATSEFFAKIEHPVLLHCKSGADRAGLLSALYLIVAERVPVRDARKQLSMRFLHFSASRTGILDALFEAYLAAHPNEAVPFLDWVAKDYDPAALTRNFRHHRFWDFLERSLLRRE